MKAALPHTQARRLTGEQIDLLLAQARIARLATVNGDRPHVAPVWFLWDGKSLYIETDASFQKARNLRKNPRCSVAIDDTLGGLRFWGILLEGEAELIERPLEEVLRWVTAIYTKYLGQEGIQATTPQKMIYEGNHVIIRLTPKKIITWNDTHSAIAPIG
jgi:PPOX class probable F420-dependent enzyme